MNVRLLSVFIALRMLFKHVEKEKREICKILYYLSIRGILEVPNSRILRDFYGFFDLLAPMCYTG